ncbi:MAG TPA: YggS family pyridoxal phosphate-dependent enzyme [Polyangiaceae bacterium]|nr:YggS family pyridoxal phosphate-dependent enzyme [Polyangiaceae bacterium]
MGIAQNLELVRSRLEQAARRANRNPAEVRLVAVSKLHPAASIREAYAAGQRDFGENYVQELVGKARELADLDGLRWHLIGHLQRNKAKYVAPFVSLLHTVDSLSLAGELAKRSAAAAERKGQPLPVLVEVSIAGEEQKSGAALSELPALLEAIDGEPSLTLRGLMCVPPATATGDAARPYFETLRRLRDEYGGTARLPELSMGMSSDLEAAVAAGATWVRVGTAIFGERPVNNPREPEPGGG